MSDSTPLPVSKATPVSKEVFLPDELIQFANQKGIPVVIDMASDIPPKKNLTRFIECGADLVVISECEALMAAGAIVSLVFGTVRSR